MKHIDLELGRSATPAPYMVLVSTIDKNSRKNVAPFGWFTGCSAEPPMLTVSIWKKNKHTYKNIKETREFVVGIPTPAIAKQVLACGAKDTDKEFKVGLTPIDSEKVKAPSIKECQSNLECKFVKETEVGDHRLVVGEIINARVSPEIFAKDKLNLRRKMDPLYHVTGSYFMDKKGKEIKVK